MNREQIKGKADEIKGDLKQRTGGAERDPAKQAEGWLQEKKGNLEQEVGRVKDVLKKDAESLRRHHK